MGPPHLPSPAFTCCLTLLLPDSSAASLFCCLQLAAHKSALGVTVGAILGHVLCTSLAVVGGRLLALRISQRTVAMVGGLLFLVFAVLSFVSPIND